MATEAPTETPTEAPTEGIFEGCPYTVTTELYPGGAIETLRLVHREGIVTEANYHSLAARLLHARWDEYPRIEGVERRRRAIVHYAGWMRMFVEDRSCHLPIPFLYQDEIEWYAPVPEAGFSAMPVRWDRTRF